MEPIKIQTRDLVAGAAVVDIDGEIDVSTSPKVKEILNDLIDHDRTNLIVNMEKVRYIDSTGLVAFISALKRVRERNGKIIMICTNPHILKIFNITGLINVFEVFQTQEEAMRIFQVAT